MGLMDKLIGKKELTPAQKREQYMVKTYKLKKDPEEPFTYWMNDSLIIRFNPADPESVQVAEAEIVQYYKSPKIQQATRDRQMQRQAGQPSALPLQRAPAPQWQQARGGGKSVWKDVENLGAGFQDVADYFTEGIDFHPEMDPMLTGKKKK